MFNREIITGIFLQDINAVSKMSKIGFEDSETVQNYGSGPVKVRIRIATTAKNFEKKVTSELERELLDSKRTSSSPSANKRNPNGINTRI
jgi:hypothetical protein